MDSLTTTSVSGIRTVELPTDVLAFCRKHGIIESLNDAVRLAEEAFSPLAAPAIVLDEEYETGERRVVIEITAQMSADQAAQWYDEYVRRRVASASPNARYHIALSLDVRGGNGPA
jgi:hypothetical protein